MALLDFGATNGLAFNIPDNYVGNMYRNQAVVNQAQAQSVARAKDFADSFKFGSASQPFYQKQLLDNNSKNLAEIGNYTNQNAGWEGDPYKRLYVDGIKSRVANDPAAIASANLAYHTKTFQDFQDKNPGLMTESEKHDEIEKINNESNFGDVRGAGQDGSQKYQFVPPQPHYNIPEELQKRAQKLHLSNYTKIPGSDEWQGEASDADLDKATSLELTDQKFTRDLSLQGIKDPKAQFDLIKSGLKAYAPQTKYKSQDFQERMMLALAKGQAANPPGRNYMQDIVDELSGKVNSGDPDPHTDQWTRDDSRAWVPSIPPTGFVKTKARGLTNVNLPPGAISEYGDGADYGVVDGKPKLMIPIVSTISKEQLDNMFPNQGLHKTTPGTFWGTNTDPKIDPSFSNDIVAVVDPKTGHNTGMYKIRTRVPVDITPAMAQKHNAIIEGQKAALRSPEGNYQLPNRPAAQPSSRPANGQLPQYRTQNGHTYKLDPATGKYNP